jgi:hypothetical protein
MGECVQLCRLSVAQAAVDNAGGWAQCSHALRTLAADVHAGRANESAQRHVHATAHSVTAKRWL